MCSASRGQVHTLEKRFTCWGLGIEGNCVWQHVIVLMFMGLGTWRSKQVGEIKFIIIQYSYIILIFWNLSSSLTGYCKSFYRIPFFTVLAVFPVLCLLIYDKLGACINGINFCIIHLTFLCNTASSIADITPPIWCDINIDNLQEFQLFHVYPAAKLGKTHNLHWGITSYKKKLERLGVQWKKSKLQAWINT